MIKSKKWVAWFLILAMVFGQVVNVYAFANDARTISVHRIDGDNVTVSRNGRSSTPRVGQNLSTGSTITTGADSSIFLQLDNDSILQTSASSQVVVGSSGNRLSLTVQSGNALMNVGQQDDNQAMETRVGNVGLTVRGTMYTMSVGNGTVTVVMLTGEGEVSGVSLPAGAWLFIEEITQTFEITYGLEFDDLPLFTLESILEHYEYLLDDGVLTPEMLESLPALIAERLTEEEEDARLSAESVDTENIEDEDSIVIYLPRPTPTPTPDIDSGNESSSSDSESEPTPTPTPPPALVPVRPPGSGVFADEFLISTPAHLLWIAETPEYWYDGHPSFSLSEFLVISDIVAPPNLIIGSPTQPFGSFFRGDNLVNNFTITLNINTLGDPLRQDYVGLFSFLTGDGSVENINIAGSVVGRDNVGGLAGFFDGEAINNSSSSANITGRDNIGGLVGTNESIIRESFATGNISGRREVGGLVGDNEGVVVMSFATGNVNAAIGGSGGLIGANTGEIEDSYATGNVSGDGQVGGLVGLNTLGGTIERTYASGGVTGRVSIGGLVGDNSSFDVNGGIVLSFALNPYVIGTDATYIGTVHRVVGSGGFSLPITNHARGDMVLRVGTTDIIPTENFDNGLFLPSSTTSPTLVEVATALNTHISGWVGWSTSSPINLPTLITNPPPSPPMLQISPFSFSMFTMFEDLDVIFDECEYDEQEYDCDEYEYVDDSEYNCDEDCNEYEYLPENPDDECYVDYPSDAKPEDDEYDFDGENNFEDSNDTELDNEPEYDELEYPEDLFELL